jgi:hypothetical protein
MEDKSLLEQIFFDIRYHEQYSQHKVFVTRVAVRYGLKGKLEAECKDAGHPTTWEPIHRELTIMGRQFIFIDLPSSHPDFIINYRRK